MVNRVAVFGATGFVGATFVERLLDTSGWEVRPIINRPGSAWRLARRGLDMTRANVLDPDQVDAAVRGCTHVVNCSRGDRPIMISGLNNILQSCTRHRVSRLVHLSSVMAYGDPPVATRESDPRQPIAKLSYGGMKNEQDKMVMEAAGAGLGATILIPPNIAGPHSYFVMGLLGAISEGKFAYLEDGLSPCQLVDVANLCHAMTLALSEGPADGSGYFVNDGKPVTWKTLVESLQPLVATSHAIGSIGRDELAAALARTRTKPPIRVSRALLHLVSSDMRQALRKDPLWERVDTALRGWVGKLGTKVERRIRHRVEGPIPVAKRSPRREFHIPMCAQQLRSATQSIDKARKELGYEPPFSFGESMEAFRRWYTTMHGFDTPYAPMLEQLHF